MRARLEYDFEAEGWIAIALWNEDINGFGKTQAEAIRNLEYQCNKHELWAK